MLNPDLAKSGLGTYGQVRVKHLCYEQVRVKHPTRSRRLGRFFGDVTSLMIFDENVSLRGSLHYSSPGLLTEG